MNVNEPWLVSFSSSCSSCVLYPAGCKAGGLVKAEINTKSRAELHTSSNPTLGEQRARVGHPLYGSRMQKTKTGRRTGHPSRSFGCGLSFIRFTLSKIGNWSDRKPDRVIEAAVELGFMVNLCRVCNRWSDRLSEAINAKEQPQQRCEQGGSPHHK